MESIVGDIYMCHGLSLLEMHLGGNDQRPQCRPTLLVFWVHGDLILIYYWCGLCSAVPTCGSPCSAVLQPLWVANAMVHN